MSAFGILRALWIPVLSLCHLASAQMAKLSEQQQREKLGRAFYDCLQLMESEPVVLTGLYCNRTWDNVMCWPDTAAGTVGYQHCPSYINMFDQAEYATKHCLDNGTWYTSPATGGRPWTNYTACMGKPATNDNNLEPLLVEHMPGIKLMYTIGYSLSLACLILAVTIMIYFKRLHCPRNMIHLNMFFAFLVRAAVSLVRAVLLVQDLGFPNDVNNTGERIVFIEEGTHWECKLFFTLFYYIIFASVMWLFNEGLYLVLILSVSVFVEKTKVRWFVLLGWGFPIIFVIPWVVCRIKLDDMLCWNVHVNKHLFWILRGPMVASVAVNFVFFIVIIRMLFTKLTASNCPESKKVRYRKLAKSTLILIPLFAVYYIGFIWLPDDLSPGSELFKIYVEMLFNSFQGFLVALLFCFLNAEVQNEIRKKWRQQMMHRRGSWRSQPSNGSFLRRSKDSHRRHSHTRSFLDSTSTITRDLHVDTAITTVTKANGHLTPICEESAPLTDTSEVHCELSEIPMSLRQDHNENHRSPCLVEEDDDIADTGFCDDVAESDDVTKANLVEVPDSDRAKLSDSGDDTSPTDVSKRKEENGSSAITSAYNDEGYNCDFIRESDTNDDVTREYDASGLVQADVSKARDAEGHNGDVTTVCDVMIESCNGDITKTCDVGECDGGVLRNSEEMCDIDTRM